MDQGEKNTKWGKSRHNMLQREKKNKIKKKDTNLSKGKTISSDSAKDRIRVADFSTESLTFTSIIS